MPDYSITDLCDAAREGDVTTIDSILDAQPDLVDVRLAENDEHRALHFAVLSGHTDAARTLVQRGSSIQSGIYPHRDATGPLALAEDREQEDLVRILRDEHEQLQLAKCENITISPENDALFDLVTEGNESEALNLLDTNADLLNACHRNGGSVIYAAAQNGRYGLVADLLSRGADITHLTPEGASPLDGAVHNIRKRNRPINEGCLIAAGMLLQAGAEMTAETAVALGDIARIERFAAESPDRFQSDGIHENRLLHIATQHDRMDVVRLLLEKGLDPDDRHQLHEYETRPDSWGKPLWHAAGHAQYDIAEMLLDAGADPNGSVYASGSPVSVAYNHRDDRMKGLLFRYGGVLSPGDTGLEGETAAASAFLQQDPDLAEELLWAAGCGGDPNIAGMCLRQLDWEPDDGRWMRILEQPLRLWRLSPHRANRDFDKSIYPIIFNTILDHGANPNVVGRFGYRLSHRIAACGNVWQEKIMTEEDRVAFAVILCDHGADLDVIDDLLQSTPLGWAARWGRYELARLFLERGADPSRAGADWARPLAWAQKKNHHGIADLIRRVL